MKLLNKKQLVTLVILGIAGTLIALPTLGSDSDHQTLSVDLIESQILEDNVAIKRAALAVDLAEEELEEAQDSTGDSESTDYEEDMNRRYYVKQAEMDLYVAEKTLDDTIESELIRGSQMYYDYLLLVKEIEIQNSQILRLNEELEGVNKKIELGSATINNRTTKELEIANATYALMQLQDDKESLFLDLNLIMQQDLSTVLVIEAIDLPFDEYVEDDFEERLTYIFASNKDLYELERQDELDQIELDIYEDNEDEDDDEYKSEILELEATIDQNVLDIADKKLSLEYDLRSKYNAVLNAYDSVAIKTLELDNLKLSLETVTKRYEVGFETENSVKAAQENVDRGQLGLLQAKLDYYVAVEGYESFLK